MKNITAKKKPNLSFWDIWNMSFGFLGIQFGFALQNANVSRIFETLGANVDDIPILWIAAPLTGLLVQPIIGYYSDRTWSESLGRRRPFFLIGAIIASIALIIMPNSPTLWIAAGMLWIMDASINVSMEPFRAFVGDNLSSEQRTMGFAMQSFFIGIGSVIASALPYALTAMGVANEAPDGIIPDSVKWSFYLGGGIFLLAILWTVILSKEYSPKELEEFEAYEDKDVFQAEEMTESQYVANGASQFMKGGIILAVGALFTFGLTRVALEKELYILTLGIATVGVLLLLSGWLQKNKNYKNGYVQMVNDVQFMPKTMRQLAVVQFFSWFALFAMWIYTTSAVTSHIYGVTDSSSALYNEGANWVGICFAAYNAVAALVAFLLPVLAKATSRKMTHLICLVAGGIGLASIYFISDPMMLLVPMIGIGIAWASIVSMPYAILTGSLPSSKMGYYMGVFNFFIVIPQIVAATILGFMLNNFFDKEPVYILFVGGASMILAGFLTLLVEDKDDNN